MCHVVTFGEWLKEKRTERGEKLTEMSSLTGVDASSLSRIENGRTEATIETVIRICEGIDVDLSQLIADLVGRDVLETLNQTQTDVELLSDVLRLEDLVQYLAFYERDFTSGCRLLAKFLQQTVNHERRAQPNPQGPVYTDKDIKRLLFPDPIYQVELAYPSDFDNMRVLRTYYSGGVLTLSDTGIYLRGRRNATHRTLESMKQASNRSASVLSRLEGGELGRIKLQTALSLNEELGQQNNEILGMFWAASQYQAATSGLIELEGKAIQRRQLGDLLITIARWLEVQQANLDWLRALRAHVNSEV